MSAGTQLRQARTERKLSIAEISKGTKIQPWVIEALEADQLQELMSPIYVKGFLASYARFLHLGPEPLISQIPWPQPEPEPAAQPPSVPAIPVTIQFPWPVLRRVALIAVAAVGVIVIVRVQPLRHFPQLSLIPKHPPAQRHVPRRQSNVTQVARTQPAPAAPIHTPSPSQMKPVEPALASVTPLHETPDLSPPPLVLQPSQLLELSVTATRATWIRVRADGKLLTQQRLQRGASERWTAKKRFELIVAQPSQVDVTLNGQYISPFAIAHRGRMVITHQGVTQLPDEE